jgi:hypothetical protein
MLPKDKGAMLLAPNPKTCTQYKKKKKSNKYKQGMKQTMPHVYKMSKYPKDKGYEGKKK